MKKAKGIIWGIVIVALGILWGLKVANILNYSMFFDGWWTLFIIVPSIIGLVTEKDKKGSLICLAVGVVLFASCYFNLWQYKRFLFPLIIVIIGASVIVGNIFDKKPEYQPIEQQNPDGNVTYGEPVYIPQSNQQYNAVFSSEKYRFDNGFAGGKFNAIFGGAEIDIRNADIVHNCVINANSVFGGIDIYVPQNVRVVLKSNDFLGGTSDSSNKNLPTDAKTVFVNVTNVFGRTDIK